MHDKDTNEAYTYSLETGKQIGATLKLEGNNLGYISRGGAIAYGKVLHLGFRRQRVCY